MIEIPCIILLGEPGIGKTTVFLQEVQKIKDVLNEKDEILSFDLGSYNTENSLINDIFNNKKFIFKEEDSKNLYLFLDGLDECKLNINNLSKVLLRELKKHPVERLFIRITCRTADWSTTLEKGLKELWKEKADTSVQIYELAPLRLVDIKESVESNQLDFKNFLDEVKKSEAIPLAIRPNTLQFLINIYKKTKKLYDTKEELFIKGCELLCEENNEERRELENSNLSPKQRLIIASRIANTIIFSNKQAIWTGGDLGNVPDSDIKIQELIFGFEKVEDIKIEINYDIIKDTLRSGLFSSRGEHRLGFSHKTYAEFLAAYYLDKNLEMEQIMNLLIHPYSNNKIITAFKEVAAWLASINPVFFREITNINPEILLLADMNRINDKDKSKLVEVLLEFYNTDKLAHNYALHSNYSKLNHKQLDKQIKPYLGKKYNKITRENAIRIAAECNLISHIDYKVIFNMDEKGNLNLKIGDLTLLDLIVNIALDKKEDIHIRTTATNAISKIGDNEARQKIKPLINGCSEDSNDELKGYSLKAVWPKNLTSKELFDVLDPPKRSNFLGGYGTFISLDLMPHITSNDLKIALNWVKEQYEKFSGKEIYNIFSSLVDEILIKSLENIDDNTILEDFVDVIILWIQNNYDSYDDEKFETLLNDFAKNEKEKRRTLIDLLVLKKSNSEVVRKSLFDILILTEEDINWILMKYKESDEEKVKLVWTELISWNLAIYNPDHRKAFKRVMNDKNDIYPKITRIKKQIQFYPLKTFKNVIKVRIKLTNRKYRLFKKNWQQKKKIYSFKRDIKKSLSEFESGNLNKWVEIVNNLKYNSKSSKIGYEPDLSKLPRWNLIDDNTKIRLIQGSKTYIKKGDPDTKGLKIGKFTYGTLLGYKSLLTIYNQDKNYINNLSSSIWEKWASIILAYPTWSPSENENTQKKLVKLAYDNASEELIKTMKILIEKECEKGNVFILSKIENCWDNKLEKTLIDIVKKPLAPDCVRDILSFLIINESVDAGLLAESFVKNHDSSKKEEKVKSIPAAVAIALNTKDAGWSVIWPAIETNLEFGKKIISKIAYRTSNHRDFLEKLTEQQLADLYIWLAKTHPPEKDPHFEDAHEITPREELGTLRTMTINYLEQKGTEAACESIENILLAFPDEEWLKQVLIKARETTIENKWVPFNPTDIVKIPSNNKYHLVQSGSQLQDVVIKSLERLEKKLHSENLPLKFLWNVYKKNYCPKNEESLSDYVKMHLEDDIQNRGIILNREVQVHGKFTDIHIDALSQNNADEYGVLKVIIEAKGCWNKGINHSMEKQLLDLYLKNNDCQHGIYLIGWFNCDIWADSDYRKKDAKRFVGEDKAIFKTKMDEQSSKLSKNGININAFVMDLSIKETYKL